MDLILWRHAEAGEPLDDLAADLERPLTPKGEKHAQRMADWLNRFLPESTKILCSPALRCRQTADALARKVRVVSTLGPGAGVEALLAATRWPASRDPVLVVGHQPTLGLAARHLMAGAQSTDDSVWSIRKGAAWWLRHRERKGVAEVVLVSVRSPDSV